MDELKREEVYALGQTEMLRGFLEESNRIEGEGPPDLPEMHTTAHFLALPQIGVKELEVLASVYAGTKAKLRCRAGMNVTVGGHRPPPGGPQVVERLEAHLALVNLQMSGRWSPWEMHVQYEALHPFMDGNGRTGRALWAWMMIKAGRDPFALPFLQRAYYEALDHGRANPDWREEAWKCFVLCGEDPDGAEARHLNPGEAARAVQELRAEAEAR